MCVACGLVMLGFGVIFADFAWDSIDLARSRPRWLSIPGQIIASSVEEQPDPESLYGGNEYSANIRYEYLVDGIRRIGSAMELVGARFDWSKDRPRPANLVAQHSTGATVTVYYDSAAPDSSTLSLSCSISTIVALALAAIFKAGIGILLVGLGMSLLV